MSARALVVEDLDELVLDLDKVRLGGHDLSDVLVRLRRLVGPGRPKQLVLTGRQLSAAEALDIGLVDRIVPAGRLGEEALAFAEELASGAVVAHGLAKRAIDGGLGIALADGLDLERDALMASLQTKDARIGLQSFLERGAGKAHLSGQ